VLSQGRATSAMRRAWNEGESLGLALQFPHISETLRAAGGDAQICCSMWSDYEEALPGGATTDDPHPQLAAVAAPPAPRS